MNKRIGTIAMLWLGLSATGAQAAEAAVQQCVTPAEAGGLILALAPDAFRTVGKTCAAVLPPSALIRQTSGPFIGKYQAESDRSWPLAQAAIVKLAGPRDGRDIGQLGPDAVRQVITAMLMAKLGTAIKEKDCALVERIVASLEPLPPHNLADLLVTIIQAADADKVRKGGKSQLPICAS